MHVFINHPLLWGDKYIKPKQLGEKQVKRIKILPENFKYLRLSKTLNDVEDYAFIVFHVVPCPRLFWGKWEQTSLNILSGSQLEKSIQGIKRTLMSKQLSSKNNIHHLGALLCRELGIQSFAGFNPYKDSVSIMVPIFHTGNRVAEMLHMCQRRLLLDESGGWY